ncbi:MAG: BrnA antitoxin family protein, partial [Terriglobia bacterium]
RLAGVRRCVASFPRGGVIVVSAKSMNKLSAEATRPTRGRADLPRLRRMTEAQIARTSPVELADLPDDFWEDAEVVVPESKQAISLRLDRDVVEWFRQTGPRYQTRMNAVLRTYMSRMRKRHVLADKKGRRRRAALRLN